MWQQGRARQQEENIRKNYEYATTDAYKEEQWGDRPWEADVNIDTNDNDTNEIQHPFFALKQELQDDERRNQEYMSSFSPTSSSNSRKLLQVCPCDWAPHFAFVKSLADAEFTKWWSPTGVFILLSWKNVNLNIIVYSTSTELIIS